MKKVLLTAAVLGAALAARAEDGAKREFPAQGVKTIRVQTESGDIQIRAGAKLAVEVVDDKKPELCLLTLEVQGDALVLKAESARRYFVPGPGCGAGFRVTAPAALSLEAKTGSGNVVLDGMSGEAALAAGSGHISGTLSGRLTAKSGSGGMELKGLMGGADAKSGSGGVTLIWAKAPAESVSVKSGSGSVVLAFPAGTKLQASQAAGSGSAVNTLGETPGAPLKVSVMTGSGDSTIEAAKEQP